MGTTDLGPDTVTSLVEDAVTAPSMHNAQPWRFVHRPGGDVIRLYGDPGRAMPESDPGHRALHLGCGAALFNLRVAAAWRHWDATIRLLPDPGDPWELAEIRLHRGPGPQADPDPDLHALHTALRRRHSSRFPYSDEPVPGPVLDGLSAAALLEGCRLVVPGPWHTDTVLSLVRDSALFEAADSAIRREIAAWTRTGSPGEGPVTEGIPAYAFGPRQFGVSAPVRDFDALHRVADREAAVFEKRPQIVLLGTEGDGPADWLRAGQAMQRVLLRATLDGLATSLISQPLEWTELRDEAGDPVRVTGRVQMIVRIGYGPAGPATPRRPVSEVLRFVE
ncbi:nitroreductase family protein [Streptomyces sp. NBC_01216]|uniref:Acg family FMN-binding oxidoreductase n=1 Tax=unclassified Streptomyces TaxID=2593676 RepID=UPI002E0F3981|nr:nitroreductase family protein [Streptomyces sp. NBC_01216]